MTVIQKRGLLLLLVAACVWSLVPLLRHSLPLDTQEALVWGKYCLWGTTKHPPLSGWLAWGFYNLFGKTDVTMYILSQLCVLIGLGGIYMLARQFLKSSLALAATFFQLGVIFYTFSSVEFNVNVVSLAIWPWVAVFFWRAYQKDTWTDWCLFGILMSLNILNKYVGGILGIALLSFVVFDVPARRILRSPRAWVGGVLCLLCLLPHVAWLYTTHFESLNYISERTGAGKIKSVFRHIVYPVKFLLAQILFVLPAGLTYTLFVRHLPKQRRTADREVRLFLLSLGIVPTLFWVVSSLVSGTPLKDMWNAPGLFAWGILAFTFVPHTWTEQNIKRFLGIMTGWSLLFAVGYGVQCLVSPSERFHSDCPAIAHQVVNAYREKTGQQAQYVGGTIWFSDMVSLYADGEVAPMIWMRPSANPWLDQTDFEKKGALVVAESEGEYEQYRTQNPQRISSPNKLDMSYHNYFGKVKTKPLYWGVYMGESHEK